MMRRHLTPIPPTTNSRYSSHRSHRSYFRIRHCMRYRSHQRAFGLTYSHRSRHTTRQDQTGGTFSECSAIAHHDTINPCRYNDIDDHAKLVNAHMLFTTNTTQMAPNSVLKPDGSVMENITYTTMTANKQAA